MEGVREGGAGSAVGATGRGGGGLTVHFECLCRIDKENTGTNRWVWKEEIALLQIPAG